MAVSLPYVSSLNSHICIVQVEVSGGRGKPATVIDKDEGLTKVILNLS